MYSEQGINKYAESKRLIQQAMREKQLVLFVGAGASVSAGMPLWKEAVGIIAKRLGISADVDTLVIPQYYYNARGKKEYTQLMREIFRYKEELLPQPVHEKIMRFNTDTIITTNYDHLIERAAENNREFIQVISKDNDLPYRKAGKELIKMHGDFENDNFVLKEDDYLHYHKNFKLIENYVKSLIGIKTILFIGYSLSDPDVKQVLAWSSEILEKDVQRAYLIKANGDYDDYEYEYFKNLGVNLIYSSLLLSDYDKKDISKNLNTTLEYLLEKDEENTLLGQLYDYLRPFDLISHTYYGYIEKVFNKETIHKHLWLNDRYIECAKDDEEGKKILSDMAVVINPKKEDVEEEKKIDPRVRVLCSIFSKSEIVGFDISGETIRFEKREESELEKAIYEFDYNKLRWMKDHNAKILSDKNPYLYIQQATIAAFLFDYVTAYTCLSNAIDILYKRKEYPQYFIALFSKVNIGHIILKDFFLQIDDGIREKVEEELNAIDLGRTLESIPDLGNENNQFLKDLQGFNFATQLFHNAYKASNRAKKEASQRYIIYSGRPGYSEITFRVIDYYLYCLRNNIIIDRYRENSNIYDIYARTLLSSLSAPDKEADAQVLPGLTSGNVHAESLTDFDLHLFLRYIDLAVLATAFTDNNITTLKVTDEAKEYLKRLTKTVPAILISESRFDKGIFEKLLLVLSHVELDDETAEAIMQSLCSVSDMQLFHSCRNSISSFIQAINTQKLYKSKKVCQLAAELLNRILGYCLIDEYFIQLVWPEIVGLLNCCYRGDKPYSNIELIKELLGEKMDLYIIKMTSALSEDAKEHLKVYYSSKINEERFSSPILYARMLLVGLREVDVEVEKRGYDFINEQITEREKGIHKVYSDDPLILFANLYINDMLVEKDIFMSIVSRSGEDFINWFVDPKEFNYDRFSCRWLTYVSESYLDSLVEDKSTSDKIVNCFYDQYFSRKTEKAENDLIIQKFLRKQNETEDTEHEVLQNR